MEDYSPLYMIASNQTEILVNIEYCNTAVDCIGYRSSPLDGSKGSKPRPEKVSSRKQASSRDLPLWCTRFFVSKFAEMLAVGK
jgi:hypothetical protein